jgi:FkbM family methyltransferase
MTRRPAGLLRKVLRASQYVRAYSNWPALAAAAATPDSARGLRDVRCRNGLRLAVRRGTSDMYIASEALAYGAYRALDRLLARRAGPRAVLDLGAHIGAFSLLCARKAPDVQVIAYEPGPENAWLLRENLARNPELAPRIELRQAAIAADAGRARWRLDPRDPSASRLVSGAQGHPVEALRLRDVLEEVSLPLACVKIDIEGGEYALLEGTDDSDWADVPAVLVELHPDPSGRSSPGEWLARMRSIGFVERERRMETILLARS